MKNFLVWSMLFAILFSIAFLSAQEENPEVKNLKEQVLNLQIQLNQLQQKESNCQFELAPLKYKAAKEAEVNATNNLNSLKNPPKAATGSTGKK